MKSLFIFLFAVLVSFQAEARNFYEAKFNFTMWYSHLVTGSKVLAKDLPTKVRVSDDSKFCVVIWGNGTLPCEVQFNVQSMNSSKITFPVATLQAMAEDTGLNSIATNPAIKASLNRLLSHLNTQGTITYNEGFTFQFHDAQPESFHIRCSDYDSMTLI